MYELKLNPRAFDSIISGLKTIEIRAGKCKDSCGQCVCRMQKNQLINFTNTFDGKLLRCIIKRVQHYDSVRKLLETEGTEYTLSSTNDLEKGIKSIHNISDYKERIIKYGVYAIELSPV